MFHIFTLKKNSALVVPDKAVQHADFMKHLTLVLFLFTAWHLSAQTPATQTIRGIVQDKLTGQSLPGATLTIPDTKIGAVSDENGAFVLKDIPIGRTGIRCQLIGYEPYSLDGIILTSTREVFLEISLNAGSIKGEEVVVSAAKNAFEAVNPLSVVSTRSFVAEETDRIPAGINDPGRVALSFPGVKQGPDETENTIIVRGNSPVGILWRVEGIDMPNPNH
ncbi:MAG: carboxypeptidase-like regulatory domain-containing protein, partial [Bacteroidota bacterium]